MFVIVNAATQKLAAGRWDLMWTYDLNKALISFSSPVIINNLHTELKGYFQNKEAATWLLS